MQWMDAPLACTVRECHLPLLRQGPALACPRGHAFDVARQGYVSLLQPQHRRARVPGDARASVEARARLLAAGIGMTTLRQIVDLALRAAPARSPLVVADLGCGTGETLDLLAEALPDVCGVGLDLSTAALARAARRAPGLTWVAANADLRLPLLDASTDVVLSIHGRRQAIECRRVLRQDGVLVVAVPAPDDLAELRARVQAEARRTDRTTAVCQEMDPAFVLAARHEVRAVHTVGAEALQDLLRATYRARRGQVDALGGGDIAVTLASDVLVFTPRA